MKFSNPKKLLKVLIPIFFCREIFLYERIVFSIDFLTNRFFNLYIINSSQCEEFINILKRVTFGVKCVWFLMNHLHCELYKLASIFWIIKITQDNQLEMVQAYIIISFFLRCSFSSGFWQGAHAHSLLCGLKNAFYGKLNLFSH